MDKVFQRNYQTGIVFISGPNTPVFKQDPIENKIDNNLETSEENLDHVIANEVSTEISETNTDTQTNIVKTDIDGTLVKTKKKTNAISKK